MDTLRRARREGVQVGRSGDKLVLGSAAQPSSELILDLSKNKPGILDLLRNPPCVQCGESDGMQALVDGMWLHEECATYRRGHGIPWKATQDDLVRAVVAQIGKGNIYLPVGKVRK
jgi:hypothetical protein